MTLHLLRISICAFLAVATASIAEGLELRVDPASSAPPIYVWTSSGGSPSLTFHLRNDDLTLKQLASLQIAVKLTPVGGAPSSLAFGTPTRPNGGVFDSLAGPSVQQHGDWTVIGFSSFPIGPFLDAGVVAPLVELPIEGIASAIGTYELVLNELTGGQLPSSSFWINQNSPFGFSTFTGGPTSGSGDQLLATLVIQGVPEPATIGLLLLGAGQLMSQGRTRRSQES
jgi:hypothetical protein